MTNRNIKNVSELKAEISRLKHLQTEQESYLNDQLTLLREKIEAPANFINKLTSWIPKINLPNASSFNSSQSSSDWVTGSLRVALPFIFNRVLFRKAGFIKKALLLLASQRAAGVLNQDKLASLIDKVSSFIRPASKKKSKKGEAVDYGIPPDSESY